jgi:hypothetical protein
MPDVIVTIPGATNVTVDDAPATSVVVIFPASNYVVTTVIDRGILFGVEGPQGATGGVNTINGQSGNVTLDTSEIPENPSALYFTNTRVYTKVKAALIAGSNVSFTYNDANQTITIAASGNVLSVNGQTGAVVLNTDNINEGSTNLYFTAARVRDAVLTGLSTATNAIISATDSVLSAFGKLQAQITANLSTLSAHIADTSNPHSVTKVQVGLGNVANVDTTNASNISSGTLSDSRLSANVTTQGNTFNTANKLVQLDASAKLPAVDGSQLTNLPVSPSTGGDLYLFYNY